jgi:ATP-dependent RNA helicase DDX24/MAK5
MLSAIAKLKFAKPTLIQTKTIPGILAGEDVIGKAQTGSGKTLAFGIPIVERWLEEQEKRQDELDESDDDADEGESADDDEDDEDNDAAGRKKQTTPIALVLSPTRELAKQLGDHLKALCDGLSSAPYICVITGGLSIQKQQRQLAKADIVIGTPGRLWEVLEGDAKLQESFTKISFLVVDEADRLLKAGQFKEAEDILGALDRKDPEQDEESDDEEEDLSPRQTLVFSATFDKDLQTKLAGTGRRHKGDEDKMAYLMKRLNFRREAKFIDANPVRQMAEGLKEGLIECGAMDKVRFPFLTYISRSRSAF